MQGRSIVNIAQAAYSVMFCFLYKPQSNHNADNEYQEKQNAPSLYVNQIVLPDNLPPPNPSFAFHQFETNQLHVKCKKNKLNSFINDDTTNTMCLTPDILFRNCCCKCNCFKCRNSKNMQNQYFHFSKNSMSCDTANISSMGLVTINLFSFIKKEEILSSHLCPNDIIEDVSDYHSYPKLISFTKNPNIFLKNSCDNGLQIDKSVYCSCQLHQFHQQKEIKCLYAGDNLFSSLIQFSGLFTNLTELYLSGNNIHKLHAQYNGHDAMKTNKQIISFPFLKILDLSHNYLLSSANCKNFHLNEHPSYFNILLIHLVKEFCQCEMPELVELNLSFNHHQNYSKSNHNAYDSSFPDDMSLLSLKSPCLQSFKNLQILHLESNHICNEHNIFEFLSQACPYLTQINLMHNNLSYIPKFCLQDGVSFSLLHQLNLGWNQISSVDDIKNLMSLKKLNRLILTGNPVSQFHEGRSKINKRVKRTHRKSICGNDDILQIAKEVRIGRGDKAVTIITESTGRPITYVGRQKFEWNAKTPNIVNLTSCRNTLKHNVKNSFKESEVDTQMRQNHCISPRIVWEQIFNKMQSSKTNHTQFNKLHGKFSKQSRNTKSSNDKLPFISRRNSNFHLRKLQFLTNASSRAADLDNVVKLNSIRSTLSFEKKMQ